MIAPAAYPSMTHEPRLMRELRDLIAIRGVKQRVEDREADIFGPRGQKSPPPHPPAQPKKQ